MPIGLTMIGTVVRCAATTTTCGDAGWVSASKWTNQPQPARATDAAILQAAANSGQNEPDSDRRVVTVRALGVVERAWSKVPVVIVAGRPSFQCESNER